MVAALKALQSAASALPGVRNAYATAKVLSLAKLDDVDPASTSKVFCPSSVPNEQVCMAKHPLLLHYAAMMMQ